MKHNYPDRHIVEKCLSHIEMQLGWGSSDEWHSDVFKELSERIQDTTAVLLSPTTLKRVWGKVNYQHAPSINTLNTLAQFAGYENWRAFKLSTSIPQAKVPVVETPSKATMPNLGIILASAAFMTLLFISLYSMVGSAPVNKAAIDLDQIHFSSKPITDGLPNSVVFDFDLNGIESDSIYIQQFWDRTKTIKIQADQQQATGIYYLPGYFRAKLLVDGEILKEHDLFIKSNNWMGTIDYQPIPKYIQSDQLVNDQLLFEPAIIEEIAAYDRQVTSTYHLVGDLKELSGDNFRLETTIRNIYRDKWAVCQTSKIVILGTKGAMIIPFAIPGCVSDIGVMLNDVYVSGKRHDLSALGVDLSDFKNVTILVENQKVSVLVEEDLVYSGEYKQTIGRLVGLRYRFLGAGEVNHLKLTNDRGAVILDGFNRNDQ